MPSPVLKSWERNLPARVVKHMTVEAKLAVRLHFRHPLNGPQQSSAVPSILLFLWFIGYFLLRDPGKYCVVTCSQLRLFAGATSMQRESSLYRASRTAPSFSAQPPRLEARIFLRQVQLVCERRASSFSYLSKRREKSRSFKYIGALGSRSGAPMGHIEKGLGSGDGP